MGLLNALIDEGLLLAELGGVPKEIWIAIRTDAPVDRLFGSGTREDPYNGSTAERFDEVMATRASTGTIVHLGPGMFRTTGFQGSSLSGWAVKPGQKIFGSGINSTILAYTGAAPLIGNFKTSIISHDQSTPVDDWEISDLTIDCNLQNQPLASGQSYAPLSLLAIYVVGGRMRVRRVKVINFGTRTPGYVNGEFDSLSYEGFPIRVGGRATDRNPPLGSTGTSEEYTTYAAVIENCIVEQPNASPGREVTCVVLSGGIMGGAKPGYKLPANYGEYAGYGERLHLQPFASEIRSCFLNCEFINGRPGIPLMIEAISYSGSTPNVQATITTRFPHNMNAGWKDCVSFLGASDPNLLAGRFQVTSPSNDSPTSRTLVCTVKSMPSGTPPSHVFRSIAPTMRSTLGLGTGNEIKVTTSENHYRLQDDWVTITGASNENYNGTFQVTSVISGTEFRCSLSADPGPVPSGDIWLDRRPSGFVRIQAVQAAFQESGLWYSVLTTYGPHYRKPGEWITPIFVYAGLGTPSDKNVYNNYVEIVSATRTTLKVRLPGNTPNPQNPTAPTACGFGSNFQAVTANGGIGGGMFGNVIANCQRGGTYHDFWYEDQFLGRENYYCNVNSGPLMAFSVGSGKTPTYDNGDPPVNVEYRTGTQVSSTAGVTKVRLTSEKLDPGIVPGVAVQIKWQSNPPPNPTYTIYDVAAIEVGKMVHTDGKEYRFFTFLTPAGWAPPSTFEINIYFQQNRYQFEDNIVDLALEPIGGTGTPPDGIYFRGPYWESPIRGFNNGAQYPWVLQSAIIRDNYIRKIGGVTDPGLDLSAAIAITSTRDLIAEGNVFPLMNPAVGTYSAPENIFRYSDCKSVKAFNNQTPSGKLWQLFNDPRWKDNTAYWLDEIQTSADDAFLNIQPKRKKPWPFS